MGAALVLRQHILALIFGRVEADVMENALVYFLLTATAYPFMGIYNAGAALFRAMGNSKVSMFCSLVVNVINITVNAVLIFGFGMGAAQRRYRHPGLPHRGGRHYHGVCSTTPTMCSGWRVCCVLSSGVPSSSASYLSASLTVWKTACFRQAS
ncbi:MAG: MATE family efflux transporter [Flavonifractor plautii]